MRLISCVFICLSVLVVGNGAAKILGIFHMPAPSHNILGTRLMTELAKKGHEVTYVTPFPLKTPQKNLKEIVLNEIVDEMKQFSDKQDMYKMGNDLVLFQVFFVHKFATEISKKTLENHKIKKLLESTEKYDLIITEQFMNEAFVGFSYKFNTPHLILSTIGSNVWVNGWVSNPAPSTYVPDLFLKFPTKMNFLQRLFNTYFGLCYQIFMNCYYLPIQDKILQDNFPGAPPLKQLMDEKLSMILVNSYPAIGDPVPHSPAMVEIGGYHVQDPKPLPKDLQDFMDSAKSGVILFSMGSNLKSANLPIEKRDAILKSFAKLKQKILWKWEDDVLPGQPENVKLSKWLPQNDIMAHPNLRAFVTHGGLLSTTEAIYHGVPIVGIPIFGDQKMNIANAVLRKYGLAVPFDELSEEKLDAALQEIINNPMYRNNIRERSAILRDQPLRPIDAATFWIEHVIRHKGAKHFRTSANDLKWYELYHLDIWAFTIVVDLLGVISFVWVVKKICCRKSKKDDKKKEEKMKKKKN